MEAPLNELTNAAELVIVAVVNAVDIELAAAELYAATENTTVTSLRAIETIVTSDAEQAVVPAVPQ